MKYLSQMLILCVIVAVNGCTIPETCLLYNNTGQNITIIQSKKHESQRKELNLLAGSSVKIGEGGWLAYKYQIVAQDAVWNYNPTIIDANYISESGFDRVFKAQIENNGCIYILQPNQKFPIHKFNEQPKGFPLLPKQY